MAVHALSLEYCVHVERRPALQAELQRLAEQHAAVVAALESATRQRCSAVLAFFAALVDRAASPTFPRLRGEVPIAFHTLQNAVDEIASLMSGLRAMTVCIQALERCLEVLTSDLEAMTVRIHALERSLEV